MKLGRGATIFMDSGEGVLITADNENVVVFLANDLDRVPFEAVPQATIDALMLRDLLIEYCRDMANV